MTGVSAAPGELVTKSLLAAIVAYLVKIKGKDYAGDASRGGLTAAGRFCLT